MFFPFIHSVIHSFIHSINVHSKVYLVTAMTIFIVKKPFKLSMVRAERDGVGKVIGLTATWEFRVMRF